RTPRRRASSSEGPTSSRFARSRASPRPGAKASAPEKWSSSAWSRRRSCCSSACWRAARLADRARCGGVDGAPPTESPPRMRALSALVLVAIAGCAGSPASTSPAGGTAATATPGTAGGQGPECVALIDIVNHGVEALEKMDGYAGLDDLERMPTIRDGMARDIEAVRPARPELRAWAAEYPKTLRETAVALR